MAIEGIDIYSRFQTVTNARSVRGSGRQFCYVKLSDGMTTRSDSGYCASLRGAGLAVGAYHYAQPGDPIAQANLLVNRAAACGATGLAPCLDLESPFTPNRTAINFAVAFVRQVRARGHRPCLYANNSMMRTVRSAVLAAVPETIIWVARYGASPSVPYAVWQYSQSGRVPGISAGSVDLDRGVVPYNVANLAAAPAVEAEGFLETMSFASKFKDWAGNTQSVQGWMNLQDKGRWEIRNRLFGLWQQALPNPWYDKNNKNSADIRSHKTYTAENWLAGANLKGETANQKLDAQAKTIAAQQAQITALAADVAAIRAAVAPNETPGGAA